MLFAPKKPQASSVSNAHLDIPHPDAVRQSGRDTSRVRCGFWTNSTTASLSLEGKTLALYLLTAPNPSVTPEDVAQLLHISHRKARHAFAELEKAGLAYRRGKETVVLTGLLEFGGARNGNGAGRNGSAKNKTDVTESKVPGFFPPEF